MNRKCLFRAAAALAAVLISCSAYEAKTVRASRNGVQTVAFRKSEVTLSAPKDAGSTAKCRWFEEKKGKWRKIGTGLKVRKNFRKCGVYRFRCKYRTKKGKNMKAGAVVIVNEKKLSFVRQPENAVGREGGKASFSVRLKKENPNVRYQWQVRKGGKFEDVRGAVGSTLTVRAYAGADGSEYRCAVSQIGLKKRIYSRTARLCMDTSIGRIEQSKEPLLRGFVIPKKADGYIFVRCADARYSADLQLAIEEINAVAGKLFVRTEDRLEADLSVTVCNPSNRTATDPLLFEEEDFEECMSHPEWTGAAYSNKKGFHYLITIKEETCKPNSELTKKVFMHELMHCIGIGHSTDVNSVIYPSITGDSVITAADAAKIRSGAEYFRKTVVETK